MGGSYLGRRPLSNRVDALQLLAQPGRLVAVEQPDQTRKALTDPKSLSPQHGNWVSSLPADELHRLGGRSDADALVGSAKIEQMPVAGDDQVGLSGQRAGEYVIVVGIVGDDTRHAGWYRNGGQAPDLADDSHWCQAGLCKAPEEFLARYHIGQLGHEHRTAAQFESLRPGCVEQAPGRAMGRQ